METRDDLYFETNEGEWKFNWPNILQQDEVWVNKRGEVLAIELMEPEHRQNAAAWLARYLGPRLHHFTCLAEIASVSGPLGPRGDMAQYYANAELDELFNMSPQQFMETVPVYRALTSEPE